MNCNFLLNSLFCRLEGNKLLFGTSNNLIVLNRQFARYGKCLKKYVFVFNSPVEWVAQYGFSQPIIDCYKFPGFTANTITLMSINLAQRRSRYCTSCPGLDVLPGSGCLCVPDHHHALMKQVKLDQQLEIIYQVYSNL